MMSISEIRISLLKDFERDYKKLLEKHNSIIEKEHLDGVSEQFSLVIEDAIETRKEMFKKALESNPYL